MANDTSFTRRGAALGGAASLIAPPAFAAEGEYNEAEIRAEAEQFFGEGAEGLASVVARVFQELGRPNGFIEGREGGGAGGLGYRAGNGEMTLMRRKYPRTVYWRGPSIGFDTGGNAARVFTLIYNMTDPEQIFQRYGGVDGSAYFVGGVGVNYQRRGNVTLAPMRFGVGFRLGASIGYLHYSRLRYGFPF